MLWGIGISSVISLIILGWCYCHKLDWQIKYVTVKLNKTIRCSRRDRQVVQPLLKKIYKIINQGMITNHISAVYHTLDLLKLAFGSGLVRSGESTHLMAIGIRALNNNKPDVASLVVDAFRPLVRQLTPDDVVIAVNQLTLIGVTSFRKKQNFLAAKVVDCILFIMDQGTGGAEPKVLTASVKALKVLGVLALRRRDAGLFREMNIRLSVLFAASPRTDYLTVEITSMLSAWLHRIIWINEPLLFTVMVDFISNLIRDDVLVGDGVEGIIDELGDAGSSACLNPHSPLTTLILDFMFTLGNNQKTMRHYARVIAISGRVAKLSVYRHGIVKAFSSIHPLFEFGRTLLRAELKMIESIDTTRQKILFSVVRENLIILEYAAKQDLLGSTGETIVDVFRCWEKHPEGIMNLKSVKKYCQLLLLVWLKNKRNGKKYMPNDTAFIEPILFSNRERQQLGI